MKGHERLRGSHCEGCVHLRRTAGEARCYHERHQQVVRWDGLLDREVRPGDPAKLNPHGRCRERELALAPEPRRKTKGLWSWLRGG